MLQLHFSISFLLLILEVLTRGELIENDHLPDLRPHTGEPDLQQIRSPLLEVFMHLPTNFRNIRSFGNTLRLRPQRQRRGTFPAEQKTIVNSRTHDQSSSRTKRQAVEQQKTFPEGGKLLSPPKDHPMLPVPDAIRGPQYTSFPVKEFDVVNMDDPEDSRRRRTESSGPEDSAQRDKRTFLEEASAETTTSVPFWKRKKENPPFVTGRASSQSGNNYTPAQHRTTENSRESHSLKNLDKNVQSNEISRSNQDNYYSSTNRRTYSRQYDGPSSSSTPKSVYDTIDYNAKRNTDPPRNPDDPKDALRHPTPPTHEHYTHRHPLDRPLYDPPHPYSYSHPYPYPYPHTADVLGRGVEYYHRTFDPATGRIVYYANIPDHPRSPDLIHRSLYVPARPFGPYPFHPIDPYHRPYVPPLDYRFLNGYVNNYVNGYSNNYVRSGRSDSQPYSQPYQGREKFQTDRERFFGGFDAPPNRLKDEYRNKTYIIYDADESRSQFSRAQSQYGADVSRFSYTPAPLNNLPRSPGIPVSPGGPLNPAGAGGSGSTISQGQFKQFPLPPAADYFPPSAFPNRNNFYSSPPASNWGFNHRALSEVTNPKTNQRPLHSPEVQLPLTTTNKEFENKTKKS